VKQVPLNIIRLCMNLGRCRTVSGPSALLLLPVTVETRYKEGPKDWQNLFAITRLFFIYFTITGVKKIVRYTEDFVI